MTEPKSSCSKEYFEDGFCSSDDKGGIFEDGVEEKVKKKKKKEKKRNQQRIISEEKGDNLMRDPLILLGSDIMLMILSCLDARSVALSLLVSRGWRAVASSDNIWSSKV